MRQLMNIGIAALLLLIVASCGNDDDNGNGIQTAFFPIKISVSAGGDAEEATLSYDDENRLIGISTTNSSSYEYSYHDNGLINQVLNTNDGNRYDIEYTGTIISSIMRVSDGASIPISYTEGRYDLDEGFVIFNTQNQLIESGGVSVEYSTLAGPFQGLDFQPVWYLDDFDFLFANYVFARNEIVRLQADIGTFTFSSERDENNNIVESRGVDGSGNERFVFTIEYEQKTITN